MPFGGTSQINAVIDKNLTSGNDSGITLLTRDNTVVDAIITNNISTNAISNGFLAEAVGNGSINVSYSNNIATNSMAHGLFIDDRSTLNINVDLGGGTLGSIGNNSILNNTLEEIRVDLDGGELSAENNFFGSAAGLLPAEVLLQDGSTIDADPFLISDPNL